MTIHYHGTPITPMSALNELAGKHFCVSHARPDQADIVQKIGQSVMLDNGAFSKWKRGYATDWALYYEWCDYWLAYPTTWAVIPDEIDAPEEAQNQFVLQWPFGSRGAPVWHMNESIDRLLMLCQVAPRVCMGSTSIYARVLSDPWKRRADEAFTALAHRHSRLPWIHMLRGMQCCLPQWPWPFGSTDSTDVGRNHNRKNNPRAMADRWDSLQCGVFK